MIFGWPRPSIIQNKAEGQEIDKLGHEDILSKD